MKVLIREWAAGEFKLCMFDTGRSDSRGCTRIAYELFDGRGVAIGEQMFPIFEGDDFAGSPLHADDSDATVAALLSFLSLRPGDTDADYFDSYTETQIAWRDARAEDLAMLAFELQQREEEVSRLADWLHDMSREVDSYDPEDLKECPDDEPSIDVRLQYLRGEFSYHSGYSDYDQDHRGSWSASSVVSGMSRGACEDQAREMIDECFADSDSE